MLTTILVAFIIVGTAAGLSVGFLLGRIDRDIHRLACATAAGARRR